MFSLSNEDAGLDMDAVLRKEGAVPLVVEMRVMNAYRSQEFRALIGDAILRKRYGEPERRDERELFLAVMLKRMSPMVVKDLHDYAQRYLPSLNWLAMDEVGQGRACFSGVEELLSWPDAFRQEVDVRVQGSQGNVFSKKNQWLFKILLLAGIDKRHWGGPSHVPCSISELAQICPGNPSLAGCGKPPWLLAVTRRRSTVTYAKGCCIPFITAGGRSDLTSTRLKHLPRVVCRMFVDICLKRGPANRFNSHPVVFPNNLQFLLCALCVLLTVCSDGSEGSKKEPVVANCDLTNIDINQCL